MSKKNINLLKSKINKDQEKKRKKKFKYLIRKIKKMKKNNELSFIKDNEHSNEYIYLVKNGIDSQKLNLLSNDQIKKLSELYLNQDQIKKEISEIYNEIYFFNLKKQEYEIQRKILSEKIDEIINSDQKSNSNN